MRVAICDKGALFREALATFLSRRGHDLVACVGADPSADAVVRTAAPDALLLDAALADGRTLAALSEVRTSGFAGRVLVISSGADEMVPQASLPAVVDHVVSRSSDLSVLEHALKGGRQAPGRPTRGGASAMRGTNGGRRPAPVPPPAHASLTPRELDVVRLLVSGSSTERMAAQLGISASTVHTHVQGVLRKLGARSRLQAVSTYLDGAAATVPQQRRPRGAVVA